MVDAFKELMQEFSRRGINDKDIVIDITGGQKPNSVVGAVVTFNRRIKAQYVQTEGDNAIIQYDVVHDTGDAGGGLGID